MSAVPRSVQRQAKAAEKLHQQIFNPELTEEKKDAETPPDDSVEKEAQAGKPDNTPAETPPDDTVQPQAQPAEAATPPTDDVDWEQKYKALYGKFQAEVPRLSRQLRQLESQNGQLMDEIDAIRQQTAVPEPYSQSTPTKKLVNDDEIEDYGADFIDVIRRAAREEMSGEIESLRSENQNLKAQLGGVSQNVAYSVRNDFYSRLTAAVPAWREVNQSDAFLVWLDEQDPYSGATRQSLLTRAFENNDAERVAAFFEGFINESSAVTPTAQQPVVPEQRQPQVAMDSLVAPGRPRSGSSAPTSAKDERVWSEQEISKFYRDCQRGAYKGREAERMKIERSIISAANKGLVR